MAKIEKITLKCAGIAAEIIGEKSTRLTIIAAAMLILISIIASIRM